MFQPRLATPRAEFAPPRSGGRGPAFALALLAHALLLGGLTAGVTWQQDDLTGQTVQAELWASVPRLGQPTPPAAVTPPPEPDPVPAPPQPRAEPQPPPPTAPDTTLRNAQIALERQQAAQADADKARQEQARRERLAKQAAEDQRAKTEAAQKAQREAAAVKKQAEELRLAEEKKAAERKAADDKKAAERKTAEDKKLADKKAADDKAREDKTRLANLARMNQMAGSEMGSPTGGSSSGNAGRSGDGRGSSAISTSYGARVAAKLRPNIVYTEEIVDNPETEVDVRATSDGTILSRKVVKSSGNKAWDEAVLNAIDKAGRLPPDVDGRYPTYGTIKFRPKD